MMNEYRIVQLADIKIEQEPSVGGDGLIHLTLRDYPVIALCQEEVVNLKSALEDFISPPATRKCPFCLGSGFATPLSTVEFEKCAHCDGTGNTDIENREASIPTTPGTEPK